MSVRYVRSPQTRQPLNNYEVAPKWRGSLLFAQVMDGSHTAGGLWTPTGAGTSIVNEHGPAVSHDSSYYLTSTSSRILLPSPPECSWLFVGRATTSTTNSAIGGFGNLSTNLQRVQVECNGGSFQVFVVNTAGSFQFAASAAVDANGQPFSAVFSVSAGRVPSVYVGRTKTTGSALTGTTGSYTGARIGAYPKLSGLAIYNQSSNLNAAFNRALTDAEAFALCDNPWQLFERRIFVPMAAAGGGSWSVTFTDAAAASDSSTRTAVLVSASMESVSGVDLRSSLLTSVSSITESVAGSDLRSATAVLASAITEAGAASDTQTATTGAAVTALESVAGADLRTALLTLQSSLTEGSTVADLVSALLVAAVAVSEAAAGVDAASTGSVFTSAVTEGVVTADTLTATAQLVAQVVEAGSVTDQHTRAAHLVSLLTEGVAGSDFPAGLLPASYSVSIAELAAAVDVLGASVLGAVSLLEVWAAWSRVTLMRAGVSAPRQAVAVDSHVAAVVGLVSKINLE